jgi:hypothetical protein
MNLTDARKGRRAWPGGYPLYSLMDDGISLCHNCLQADEVHEGGEADGWRYEGSDVYWEGPDMQCGHCYSPLPSAYGEPAEKEGAAFSHRGE